MSVRKTLVLVTAFGVLIVLLVYFVPLIDPYFSAAPAAAPKKTSKQLCRYNDLPYSEGASIRIDGKTVYCIAGSWLERPQ